MKNQKKPENAPKIDYPLGIVISKDNSFLNFGQTVDVLSFCEFSDELIIREHGTKKLFALHYTEIWEPTNTYFDLNTHLSYHEERYWRNRPEVTELTQTCRACPSQWEARTKNGEYIYIRYRNGWFRAELYNSEEAYNSRKEKPKILLKLQFGGKMDGCMKVSVMKKLLKKFVNFSDCKNKSTEYRTKL